MNVIDDRLNLDVLNVGIIVSFKCSRSFGANVDVSEWSWIIEVTRDNRCPIIRALLLQLGRTITKNIFSCAKWTFYARRARPYDTIVTMVL